ncbi:MAG: DUF2298 domain-containing protein, partial [Anaerolineaceae bacterium]|nr:DUF2298 domain-containing protein [Anaerolineaceae bacterium]
IVRYTAEALNLTGYSQIYLVGRHLSGVADLVSVLLVYLIALRLYRRFRLALLAAAFSAVAVLQIQLSHYFTVDTFANTFMLLAFYFAVKILTGKADGQQAALEGSRAVTQISDYRRFDFSWLGEGLASLIPYGLFGAVLGLAMASKVSALPVALLLPVAAFMGWQETAPAGQRRQGLILLRNLAAAAVAAFIVFRIFQPYAFSGPGFFGIHPNPRWLANLSDLSYQSRGDVDFPPALQWARRPVWFAWENLTLWGLGLPLGLLAWAGFGWMGWRILRGEWKKHLLLWGWTAVYFVWQSLNFTRSMRYQLPIYPLLAIIAAWAVFALWERTASPGEVTQRSGRFHWNRVMALLLGVGVLAATTAWAFAFTRIYTRPVTRVEASRWIYQNVPTAINLQVESVDGAHNQALPFPSGTVVSSQRSLALYFTPRTAGLLEGVQFAFIVSTRSEPGAKQLVAQVRNSLESGSPPLAAGTLIEEFYAEGDPRGRSYTLTFEQPLEIQPGQELYLIVESAYPNVMLNLAGPIELRMNALGRTVYQPLPEPVGALRAGEQFVFQFIARKNGLLKQAALHRVVDWEAHPELKTLRLSLTNLTSGEALPNQAELRSAFLPGDDHRGQSYTLTFDPPVQLTVNQSYLVTLQNVDGTGALAVYGSRQALESTWDDALPLGLEGYSPYDYNMGVYRSDLNFEMYWDDTEEKRERFMRILDQADYVFISSNRQWGTTVRVPERYPLTTALYRSLLGCPPTQDILWCYRVAQEGKYQGDLGFELVKVFQSDPNLGTFRFNTQFAEEAFTVYDHPKVMIFQKTSAYNPQQVHTVLEAVDLARVVRLTPRQAAKHPGDLMLTDEQQAVQQAGGTWSQLFDRAALPNRYPVIGLGLWYLAVTLLGWVVYPFVRLALRSLPDRGYPVSRLVGLILLAYPVWLAGSAGIAASRMTISLVFVALLAANVAIFILQRKEMITEWRRNWRYYLTIETLALAFFLLFLLVRLGNPDLWHPYKGGEKPMDFSFLNAVIKSTTFPPYDPWFAGGYINYYYYGFVLVGVLVKWLGIVPSIAYNLALPTLFSMLVMAAFSFGWNLLSRGEGSQTCSEDEPPWMGLPRLPALAGVVSAVGLLILGNLGTVRMLWHGLQRLAATGSIEEAGFWQRWVWTFEGLGRLLSGNRFPYGSGDWYWIPSRAIPGESITEFPFFTFLYADLHAHLIALPVTVLALLWGLAVIKSRWQWGGGQGLPRGLHFAMTLLLGGLVIGALRAINTWDLPLYLVLGVIALMYTAAKYAGGRSEGFQWLPIPLRKVGAGALSALLLVGLAFVFYQPFAQWYGQGYNALDLWEGSRTPFWSYVTHWGLFLFVVISWLVWETRDWLAKTPLSAIHRLKPVLPLIWTLLIGFAVISLGLVVAGVRIGWLVVPAGVWTAALLFRPGQPDEKRAALFMVGTALAMTLAVEVIVLQGDIGRMNTVFKFYLQAWTLFSLVAAAAFIWLLAAVNREWLTGWRISWQVLLAALVGSAALFPILAGADKITDRMSREAPHTLDGMTYMTYARYNESGTELELSEDYRAIRWMQENVQGSPVIVEANTPEYRWGSRFTIYTGLPGVVGWNWHQRQQRAVVSADRVTERVAAVGDFYNTLNRHQALTFLRKYNVRYIIVGQLEQGYYSAEGIAKFAHWQGDLWQAVYRDGTTTIYETLQ